MSHVSVVIVGAGQAGLAVSHLLTSAGVDHVVLERGRTAQRWDSHYWDSLRLLTPNWLSRLPGYRYTGEDPAGFMTAAEVSGFLRTYALGAPVVEGAEVTSVHAGGAGYRVRTGAGTWSARAVVVATGWCDLPRLPGAALDTRVEQLTPASYRNPATLPDGGVLIVGASASGTQLADELVTAGRTVMLAVGSHSRLPRRYRGFDIMWWLDAMGVLDRRLDERRSPAEPSMQLVGRSDGRDVDLRTLQDRGVRLAGRLTGVDGHRLRFADDLADTTRRADRRLVNLLRRVEGFARAARLSAEIEEPPVRAARTGGAVSALDLRRTGIGSVIWATGYRRAYPWLHVPVLDPAGEIRHRAGATAAPGLYVIGMRWQSRRNSAQLDGVRHDAVTVVSRVLDHLGAGSHLRRAA
ncbi:MAG TPA: NAD(P)/FAD-dependent oxidoreductase [Actinoplanes sp.]|nr:NAD(P)/FAD-dependent oxidoreductase [Actinoplanes sp.]